MGGEARTTTLGIVADLLTGYPFDSARFTDDPTDIRLLRGDNVAQGRIRWDGVRRWSMSAVVNGFLLQPGDVILAMDRPWIEAGLKHATLTADDCPSLLVQRVACLRARPGLDQRFLGYLIRSQRFTQYVLGIQTGTAVPHISGGQIRDYTFQLPSLSAQRKAADLLGALDDKIDSNRRMAETLEAMARALFKSWFVDFDPVHARAEGRPTGLPDDLAALFPDSFSDDGRPHGWALTCLSNFAELDRSTCDPAVLAEEAVAHHSIPSFDSGRRPVLEPASNIRSLKLKLTAPVVLFSKLNPETPRVWPLRALTAHIALASTEYLAFRPVSEGAGFAYLAGLLSSKSFGDRAASMVTGTSKSHQRVQVPSLLATEWLHPPRSLMASYEAVAGAVLARADLSRVEYDTLATLRDTLLPKLISGELRIADAERQVAAA